MTEKQVELLITFRKAVVGIKGNSSLVQEDYYNELINLNSKLQSALKGEYKPVGLSFANARELDVNKTIGVNANRYVYRDDELDRCADVMLATIDGIIAKIPNYDHICHVRADIKRAKTVSAKKRKEIIVELVSKYSDFIKFDKIVLDFAKPDEPFSLKEDQSSPILKGVIGRLELYLASLSREKPKQARSSKTIINNNVTGGNATANASASAQVTVDISVQIDQTIEEVKDACLKPEEEAAILAKLNELKEISQEKNKRTKWDKIKGVFQWLAEQGLQVAGWLVPLIYQIMQGV